MSTRTVIIVGNDKGGVGKSVTARELYERISSQPDEHWQLVEIEARTTFTQQNYRGLGDSDLLTILLVANDPSISLPGPSLDPLERLWSLIPKEASESSRILVDCGASAFQNLFLWGVQRRGFDRFIAENYRFIFFVVVQGSDKEAADFFNITGPMLEKLGHIVLVKNLRQGNNFSQLDGALAARTYAMELPFEGERVVAELSDGEKLTRLTFEQLANNPNASHRARRAAGECAKSFAAQIQALKEKFII